MRVVMRLRKKNLNNADVTLRMGGKQLFVLVLLGSIVWEKSGNSRGEKHSVHMAMRIYDQQWDRNRTCIYSE